MLLYSMYSGQAFIVHLKLLATWSLASFACWLMITSPLLVPKSVQGCRILENQQQTFLCIDRSQAHRMEAEQFLCPQLSASGK